MINRHPPTPSHPDLFSAALHFPPFRLVQIKRNGQPNRELLADRQCAFVLRRKLGDSLERQHQFMTIHGLVLKELQKRNPRFHIEISGVRRKRGKARTYSISCLSMRSKRGWLGGYVGNWEITI